MWANSSYQNSALWNLKSIQLALLCLHSSGQKNMGYEINEGIFKFFLKWHLTRACSCVVCSVSCFLHQHAMCFLFVPWLTVRWAKGEREKKAESSRLKSNDGIRENFIKNAMSWSLVSSWFNALCFTIALHPVTYWTWPVPFLKLQLSGISFQNTYELGCHVLTYEPKRSNPG